MYKIYFNVHNTRWMLVLLLGAVLLTSCDDFLDVRPKSEKVEDDLFKNADGFESAIYGVYGSMQVTNLYGKELYWGLTDIMAQDLRQIRVSSSEALEKYEYNTNDDLQKRFSNVWTAAYTSIGYANNVLKNLEGRSKQELPLYNLYKGEMLAVRAYLHFDLLRLFASTDMEKQGIPYTTTYSASENEFKKVGEDYELILADLQQAEQLLGEEKDNIVYPRNNNQYFKFQNYRETHCNYYAVLGMLAKVYWMKGDMANAAKYAQMVIDSQKFPLADVAEIKDLFAGKLSDKETLWGLYSNSYTENAGRTLNSSMTGVTYNPCTNASGRNYLMPYDKVYSQDVSGTAQDYRLNWFTVNTGGTVSINKTWDTYTYGNATAPENWANRIDGINMLHVSELYLIAAEALLDTDYDKAVDYFNAEVSSRGLPTLTEDQTLTTDMIFNEYHKEMFGEGQVWYNMKRLNKDISSNAETRVIPASDNVYVVPIPQDELDYRN